MKNIKNLAAIAALSLAFAPGVHATPAIINGTIEFSGVATLNQPIATATSVTFTPTWTVSFASGDYTGLVGEIVTFNPTSLSASDGTYGPFNGFWSVTGTSGAQTGNNYTFDLTTFTVTSDRVAGAGGGPGQHIDWLGSGTAYGTGLTQQSGAEWYMSLSTNLASRVTFTTSSQSTTVPEGGNLMIALGSVFAGLVGLRRLRARA